MLQGEGVTNALARKLRREMSPPEIKLWQALRTRPAGLKFRRQHPSRPYVADFYCHEARLVVEVDSEAHERGDRAVRDAVRDQWCASRGLQTMRISAREITRDTDAALRGIVSLAATRRDTGEE